MSKNNRKHPREEIKVSVELTFVEDRYKIVNTRDISKGGMFIELEEPGHYPVGEMVHVHYLDPLDDNADTFKDAIIVRIAADGIAISFIEMDEF